MNNKKVLEAISVCKENPVMPGMTNSMLFKF